MELESQMVLFARSVDSGSFSAASRELNYSPSAVSRQISDLENKIGVRLLNRSSQGISLTEEGHVFYSRCVEIRRNIASALDLADSLSMVPEGRLRINTTVAFGKSQMLPALRDFYQKYPRIRLSIDFNDRPIDLATTPIDVAIQFAEQIRDQSLIGRKLAVNHRVICAAPTYISAAGDINSPEDLLDHNILRLSAIEEWNDWIVDLCDVEDLSNIRSNFEANSADALYHAALAGLGIARLPTYLIARDIAEGRLINLFPDMIDSASNIYAVYMMKRNMSPKIRVFLDFLAKKFGSTPPWERHENKPAQKNITALAS